MKYSGIKKLLMPVAASAICLSLLSGGALASEEISAVGLADGGVSLRAVEAVPLKETPVTDGGAEGISIGEQNFPDENFRRYVAQYLDGDQNGYLSAGEIESVIALDCGGCGIGDLTGVAYFTALEYLYCGDNHLETLDVSGLGALYVLDCSGNNLTELDVSGCGALEELWAQDNDLTALDLTNNPPVEACLEACNLMETNGVESWSGAGMTPLKNDSGVKVTLAGGILLNRGNFPDDAFRLIVRDGIDADGNGYMTKAEAAEVTELECAGWDIADFTGLALFPNLTRLDCRETSIQTLDLRDVPALETVYLRGERIEADGFWVYVYEETDGVLMVDKGVPVWTKKGGADVDGDGDTDAADALAVLRHIVGAETLTGEALAVADATGNSAVDIRDAAQILRFVNHLPSTVR